MKFETPEAVKAFVDDQRESSSTSRSRLSVAVGKGMAYYEGAQWISGESAPSGYTQLRRYATDWNPDADKLRVTVNRVTRNLILCATATHPRDLFTDVLSGDPSAGVEGLFSAQVFEDTLNEAIELCGVVQHAGDANFRRCICGTYGIGLSVSLGSRIVQGREANDWTIKAFSFPPSRLVLDPFNQSRDLRGHDWVIYSDVMSKSKIERLYGVQLAEEQVAEIGQLTPMEQEFANLTNHRLFGDYAQHSKTPGAAVHQLFCKDGDGPRFNRYYVAIETKGGEFIIPNLENSDNPFGGDGMPYVLLHGHRRANEMWSLSDVSMMMDDQDRMNTLASMIFRHVQRNAMAKIHVDKRWFGTRRLTDEQVARKFSNAPFGIITSDGPAGNAGEPKVIQYPQPPSILEMMVSRYSDEMRDQVFRAAGHEGITKTHVTAEANERNMSALDSVLGVRGSEDIAQYEKLLRVLLGTTIMHVKAESPGVLASLVQRRKFGEQEMAVLSTADPINIPCDIRVREQSVRFLSHTERRHNLDVALQSGTITPAEFRSAMAADLDTAVSQQDRRMAAEARVAAMTVLAGEEWVPLPLGFYTDFYLRAFELAMMDKRTRNDPEARQRLARAITVQEQMKVQQQIRTDPAIQVQMMQQAQQASQEPADDTPTEDDLLDLGSAIQTATEAA